MLIRRGTLLDGRVADVRVGDRVLDVAAGLTPSPGERVLDAELGAVLPGLHDHHLHLRAADAALDSVPVGPPAVRTPAELAKTLRAAAPGVDGWIRAVGYHDSVAGELNRLSLDALVPDTPLRLQHRSGALWILNSTALARIGLADHPSGRLRSADRRWSEALPRRETGLTELSRRLTGYGVTGVTDATPDLNVEDIVSLTMARRRGQLRQRLFWLAPGKRILHDDRLDLDALTGWIAHRHDEDLPVAVHCVTAAQLVVTIAALRATGSHRDDRVEHAAIVPDDNVADLVELGVTVVTQPNFIAERGEEYLHDVPADEQRQLWRVATLAAAGIPVAASTDAPFGALDPWAAMRAAVHRATPDGRVVNAPERVSPRRALTMFLGRADRPAQPRSVEPGQPGDLCVLNVPPAEALRLLASDMVAATVIGGEVVETVSGK
jgi:predicted amidohydrolase YtcJ